MMTLTTILSLSCLAILFCGSVEGWKFPPEQHTYRHLQLNEAGLNLLEECEGHVDDLYEANPNILLTRAALFEYESEASDDMDGCSTEENLELLRSNATLWTGDTVEFNCTLDYANLTNGIFFSNFTDECTSAGGIVYLFHIAVVCNYTVPVTAAADDLAVPVAEFSSISNLPDCRLSQDVQPSCDFDLFLEAYRARLSLSGDEFEATLTDGYGDAIVDPRCYVTSFDMTGYGSEGIDSDGTWEGADENSAAALHSIGNIYIMSAVITGLALWWPTNYYLQ
jgi:hypothetical protein